MTMSIRIFVTGGTFDKEYNELSGELFFKETHLYEMLKLGRCGLVFVMMRGRRSDHNNTLIGIKTGMAS